jgi:DinB superfamily
MKDSDRICVETLVAEFDEEMANTRLMLERVPDEKLDWKPHDRASTLAKLTSHIAFIPTLPELLLNMRIVDRPLDIRTKAELLERFDKSAATGRTALDSLHDERLAKPIPVTPGVSKPLAYVLRMRVMNHLIHHRGQLSTYLRALGEPVPGMYGPSSDEKG